MMDQKRQLKGLKVGTKILFENSLTKNLRKPSIFGHSWSKNGKDNFFSNFYYWNTVKGLPPINSEIQGIPPLAI